MYIKIKLDNNLLEFKLENLIEKIELYCSDYIVDILTPDLINIYINLYKNSTENHIYDQLYLNNHRNIYYIPLLFPCLKENTYIPLHLLNKENLYLKIYFKDSNYKVVYSQLLIESKILNKILDFKKEKYPWLIETVNYVTNIELNNSINGEKNNTIRLKNYFNKLVKGLIITLNNSTINDLKLRIDDNVYIFDKKKLSYINLLESNLYYNSYNKVYKNLFLISFSLFKSYISGFVNFNEIKNCDLELKPYKNISDITFFAIQKLSPIDNYYYAITELPTIGTIHQI